jgi:hypothetical protein
LDEFLPNHRLNITAIRLPTERLRIVISQFGDAETMDDFDFEQDEASECTAATSTV